jgi:plasmid stabilization system protein ParE
LPEALADLERLRSFLDDQRPAAAARAARTLRDGARRLVDFPHAGHALNDGTGRRELILPFGAGAYVLRYRIDGDDPVIIRAWHSRENRGAD